MREGVPLQRFLSRSIFFLGALTVTLSLALVHWQGSDVRLTWRLTALGLLLAALFLFLHWWLLRRIVRPLHILLDEIKDRDTPHVPTLTNAPTGFLELALLSEQVTAFEIRLTEAWGACQRHVAELERIRQDLVTSEEHYRMLWNYSFHSRLLVNADGLIMDVNRRSEIKLWRPAAHMIGTRILSFFCDEDRPRVQRALTDAFKTGKELTAGEFHMPSPAEDVFIMEVDLVPLLKNGEVQSVIVQLADMTEQKRLQEQLLRSERLASLSQFASMFAHDIRNPLVGIKKLLELLAHRQKQGHDVPTHYYEDMRFTIDLLLGMINDMLDVYQESHSGLPLLISQVSVPDLVEDAIHLFRMEAEAKRIRFRLDLPGHAVAVQADGRRLLRVLINLLHNALKFSPTEGTITVAVHQAPAQSLRPFGVASLMRIIVSDEGPGILPTDLPHLFEMFFHRREPGDIRGGRGLGLHFCRLVTEAHGGTIRATNGSAGGAVFTLELPMKREVYADQFAHR